MSDEELEAQFAKVMPAEFTREQRQKTYQVFREINGHSYEQIAVLMEMQRQMVMSLMGRVKAAELDAQLKASKKIIQATQLPTRKRFINGE